jgi:hypothetical protein
MSIEGPKLFGSRRSVVYILLGFDWFVVGWNKAANDLVHIQAPFPEQMKFAFSFRGTSFCRCPKMTTNDRQLLKEHY